MNINRIKSLKGSIHIPGDKSISHRGIMLGALANGKTEINHFLQGADCLSTISCFQKLGIDIVNSKNSVLIEGKGLHGLLPSKEILDVGNSGTTTRLLSGILAGQSFITTLNGDASIQKRPMNRIITPLTQMGAKIESLNNNGCTPLKITGSPLKGIHYHSPIASAQVKSCILLAGLYADSPTSVTEPFVSRNHTELMSSSFGAEITVQNTTVTIDPDPTLEGQKIDVPGDISSAAFFIVAGLIIPNSEIIIKNVGINPTRDGILKVCKDMGANIKLENIHTSNGELIADIIVSTSSLTGTVIEGSIIPTLIDEIPIIAVLACFAKGTTVIKDAQELKVKESNRIDVMVRNLTAMGADISATDDGMIIKGGKPLHGAVINSDFDHRIAMAFSIAALNAESETEILGIECINISYPDFFTDLNNLIQK
ncbi:3-phosphoshikimate 1-carboxyvinyltransferase [Anaerosacchariphilus polymeriproducens]|uniref:3-phosphoshikimate 1-carboxyvinyltransferase n=1 Tax=Anaerosacchariphilus polymeriproducens TaxID=1812858 RepID=A0A371ATU9_9FIRM|nr:3-phosphoshikimate 1-carboxyvinyltransferase [Anaerosacchariphilus polymeriproducens]RDU22993.1 3-phosphoshikimate 1-carboxyvinyltransferase [Anaerosacchariphilus polymeriproducens]